MRIGLLLCDHIEERFAPVTEDYPALFAARFGRFGAAQATPRWRVYDLPAGQFPHREMVRNCGLRCRHMNTITLEDTLLALELKQYEVKLSPEIIAAAKRPIDRMLEIR